jgi:hypothetical protein
MNYLKTIILVVILLVIGFFLLPYVKVKPQSTGNNTSGNTPTPPPSSITTYSSDNLDISFTYNPDQDADGTADTAVKEMNGKVYVYYAASSAEQGQWVEQFPKDPKDSLTVAITKKFLTNYPSKDCFSQTLQDFYKSFGVTAPTLDANIQEAVIAFPRPADDTNADDFFAAAAKCPATYTETNGISYFWMDTNHPDKYYFFSIGQYAIFADTAGQKTWEQTVKVK